MCCKVATERVKDTAVGASTKLEKRDKMNASAIEKPESLLSVRTKWDYVNVDVRPGSNCITSHRVYTEIM